MKKYGLFAGLGLIALVIIVRLMPHASNLTPLYAVALLAAAVFPKRWAIAIPMVAMVISDLVIGLHSSIAFTWSGMLVFAWLGFGLTDQPSARRVAGSAVLGSTVFFLWTNLGVWLVTPLYAQTPAGLAQCFTAALPFFRNSLLGNIAFAGVLFAAYNWYSLRLERRTPVPVSSII
jgi:hypothetical protein